MSGAMRMHAVRALVALHPADRRAGRGRGSDHAPADRGRAGRRPRARRAVSQMGIDTGRDRLDPARCSEGQHHAAVDQETPASPATGRSTREQVVKAFAGLAAKAGEDDTVVIVLFGHGTFDGSVAKFNLPGPDMSPADFAPAAGAAAIRSAWSSSTPRARAGPSSKPCPGLAGSCWRRRAPALRSSRRSSAGRSWTRLRPKPRTPIAMAVSPSSRPSSTRGSRSRRNISATGCSRPSTPSSTTTATRKAAWNPARKEKTGRSPRVLSLGSTRAEAAPATEQLRTLYAERQALERRIESLKLLKSGMDPDKYSAELEKLATELARQGTSDSRSGREEQMRSAAVLLVGLLIASAGRRHGARAAQAARPSINRPVHPSRAPATPPYDGRVVFIRLRYDTEFGGFRMRMGPPWSHDYPRGEMHFMKIIEEITQIRPRTDGSNILSLDDPELFNYPVAYMASRGSGRRPTSRPRTSAPTCRRAGS